MEALTELDSPKILDLGCGTGRTAIKIAKKLKNGGHLYGCDIYNTMAISGNALSTVQQNARIEKVSDKTTFQYGSVLEIPFKDAEFDIVNLSSVLHEIHDPEGKEKALTEIYRVLKPRGHFYMSEWNRAAWQCIAMFGLCCFVFKHKKYWTGLLKSHGFKEILDMNLDGFELFKSIK